MSSTTTSESSDDSSDQSMEEIQQAQDADVLTKERPEKRKREDDEKENDDPLGFVQEPFEVKEVKKPPRKMRKMELPVVEGYLLNLRGCDKEVLEKIAAEFEDPLWKEAYPEAKCNVMDAKYVKRIPTEEEKKAWQAETKRLSKEKLKAEGKVKKELSEAEKEKRRLKNADPEYQLKKKEMAKIKREVFNQFPENKEKYKKIVIERLGPTPRKKRVTVKKDK